MPQPTPLDAAESPAMRPLHSSLAWTCPLLMRYLYQSTIEKLPRWCPKFATTCDAFLFVTSSMMHRKTALLICSGSQLSGLRQCFADLPQTSMPLKRYEPDEMLRWDWCGKSEQIESKAIEGKRERSDWAGKAYTERPGHFEHDTLASNGDKSESARTGLILPCGVIKPEHVNLYQ